MATAEYPLRLLLLSTPVAPLGGGGGGGVELTLINLIQYLTLRGHSVEITAPKGSVIPFKIPMHTMKGNLQPPAQHRGRKDVVTDSDRMVLTNMCRFAKQNQERFDLIVSFAYDWLPVYLTPGFDTPVAHFISMSSMNDALDYEITRLASLGGDLFGCYSTVQAGTFPDAARFRVLGFGLDLTLYDFCGDPADYLVWAGRISPEKGLEDAVEVARSGGYPLKIVGRIDDPSYRDTVVSRYRDADIEFTGFLSTPEMQAVLRKAKAMLMTPHWVEAFGIVTLEALACGVPVVSYDLGGPSEIIEDGVTGFLVPPGNREKLEEAMKQLASIDRLRCRQKVEADFSLDSWGAKMVSWFKQIVERS